MAVHAHINEHVDYFFHQTVSVLDILFMRYIYLENITREKKIYTFFVQIFQQTNL